MINNLQPGWLIRQLKLASEEVNSWPDWKKENFKLSECEPIDPKEHQMRHNDSKKYGNY